MQPKKSLAIFYDDNIFWKVAKQKTKLKLKENFKYLIL
jgi:hypothetical protein